MVIFLCNLYIFVWIQQGCLDNIVSALDPSNSVIQRLWCTYILFYVDKYCHLFGDCIFFLTKSCQVFKLLQALF